MGVATAMGASANTVYKCKRRHGPGGGGRKLKCGW
jgi:hypothetical protein